MKKREEAHSDSDDEGGRGARTWSNLNGVESPDEEDEGAHSGGEALGDSVSPEASRQPHSLKTPCWAVRVMLLTGQGAGITAGDVKCLCSLGSPAKAVRTGGGVVRIIAVVGGPELEEQCSEAGPTGNSRPCVSRRVPCPASLSSAHAEWGCHCAPRLCMVGVTGPW